MKTYSKNISLIIFVTIFIQIELVSQKRNNSSNLYNGKYAEFLETSSELRTVNYYQTVEKVEEKYIQKTYNPDKLVLTILQTFKDSTLENLDGKSIEWYDNGNLWKEGGYKENLKSGTWKYYKYWTGKIEKYGDFENGLEEGKWYTLDSLGRTTSEYNYQEGKLEGEYLRYDTSGIIYQKQIYNKGVELVNEILDSIKYQQYTGLDEFPILESCSKYRKEDRQKCRDAELLKFIYKNIGYPSKAIRNEVEGEAVIRFVVNKDGSIDRITLLRGICREIEKECIRIIKKMPDWLPGKKGGEPKNTYFNLPIRFKLE